MSGDITGEFNLSDDAQQRLAQEVAKQVVPLAQELAIVKKSVEELAVVKHANHDRLEALSGRVDKVGVQVQELTNGLAPLSDIVDANQHRLATMTKAVDEVKRQNGEQSHSLSSLTAWSKELWGNGSGRKGFLEKAREEDKERLETMASMITSLTRERYKEEGKKDLLEKQEETRLSQADRSDAHKTHMWTRYHYALGSAAILFGSWFWSLVRPLARLLVDHMVKALQ